MRKSPCFIGILFSLTLLMSLSSFTAFAADNHYYIKELKLNLDLPQEMVAITRESPETNKYFSLFGLDYETTMTEFENNHIYLQGMYEDSSRVLTVTMVSDENSKSIGNYSALSDDQLIDVEESFLNEDEYSSCTIQRFNNFVFMNLQFKTETDGEAVYAEQCNTVVDGNNITLTLQPSKDNVLTDADYQIMSEILQSAEFSDKNIQNALSIVEEPEFWYCVIAGVVILAIIIVVIVAVKRKKSSKKSHQSDKKRQNEQLLQELAREFSAGSVPVEPADYNRKASDYVKSADSFSEETAEEIITQFRNSEDYESIQTKKRLAHTKSTDELNRAKVPAETIVPAGEKSNDNKQKSAEALNASDTPVLKVVTPEDSNPFEEDDEYAEDYYYDDEEDEYNEDDYEEDNEVIGSERSFNQSGDYFDEAPNDEVYSRSTADDEDEYEKNKKSSKNKGNAGKTVKTAGAVILNGILIFLNGVKSFFIHIGYFVTNLTRLIKRKHNINKRKKAEAENRRRQQEALRRKRENLQRKQQKQSVKDASGLVKVHSQAPDHSPSSAGRKR